jgi:catechol 2,3-dioxygenase-like lactoylglutathione lyase family enzyme
MPEPLPPCYGLRHVALYVRDLRAAEAFYCGQLGFQVEWRPDPENLYLVAAR